MPRCRELPTAAAKWAAIGLGCGECVFCLILCLAQVRLVYPMVPDRICSILGVPSLEAIAMEQLDQSVPLRQLQDIQVVTVGRGAMGWLARFILTACNDRGRGRTLRQ